jgi:hypothetical protein
MYAGLSRADNTGMDTKNTLEEEEVRTMTGSLSIGLQPPDPITHWCQCKPDPLAEGTADYFQRPDGRHGWWHPECDGLVQSG